MSTVRVLSLSAESYNSLKITPGSVDVSSVVVSSTISKNVVDLKDEADDK